MSVDVRWLWVFLDTTAADAATSWAWWSERTHSRRSDARGTHGEFATLEPPAGDPWIKVQAVQSPGPGGGTHLDLDVDDPGSAAEQAVGLGAHRVGSAHDDYVSLRSPGGYPFCLTTAAEHPRLQVREGVPDLLDQLCLDIPADRFDDEVEFWGALTGWEWADSDEPEFGFFRRPDGIPARILTQRVGEARGEVRGHVDLACVDRRQTQAQHVQAGAIIVAEHGFWCHLRDPWGRDYCLTSRTPVQEWVQR